MTDTTVTKDRYDLGKLVYKTSYGKTRYVFSNRSTADACARFLRKHSNVEGAWVERMIEGRYQSEFSYYIAYRRVDGVYMMSAEAFAKWVLREGLDA